jgi:hypothetical protein
LYKSLYIIALPKSDKHNKNLNLAKNIFMDHIIFHNQNDGNGLNFITTYFVQTYRIFSLRLRNYVAITTHIQNKFAITIIKELPMLLKCLSTV